MPYHISENTESALKIRDLSDFCARWSVLEKHVSDQMIPLQDVSPETRETLKWLRILAEKTCATFEE